MSDQAARRWSVGWSVMSSNVSTLPAWSRTRLTARVRWPGAGDDGHAGSAFVATQELVQSGEIFARACAFRCSWLPATGGSASG